MNCAEKWRDMKLIETVMVLATSIRNTWYFCYVLAFVYIWLHVLSVFAFFSIFLLINGIDTLINGINWSFIEIACYLLLSIAFSVNS